MMDIKAGNFNLGKSISIHILLIFVLSLLLLIPKLFFDFVLSDRQMMLDSALHSITDSWAHEQLIAPPVLAFKGQKTVFTDWGCGQNPGLKPGVKHYVLTRSSD